MRTKPTQEFIDAVMILFDEDREPISRIANILNCTSAEVEYVICSQIANTISDIA